MQYVIKDLMQQLIDSLKIDSVFTSVTVARHVGEVNPLLFTNPAYWEGLVQKIPFVLIRYKGRTATSRDSIGSIWFHELEFGTYVGTKSLRSKEDAVEEADVYLARIFDLWHGRMFYSQQTFASVIPILAGTTQITTTGFNQQRALMEAGGQDERLIMALPEITLYETRYTVKMLAHTV